MALDVAWNETGTRARLRFSHPTGNILTAALVDELSAALDDIAEARHVRLVTIEGAGADFSFGASVPEHRPGEIETVLPAMHAMIQSLLSLPAPTAAVVRGRCLGGGFELALACDFIFASDDATFGLPEIALGVFPPAGSVLLPLRAGGARATSAVLTGRRRSAADWAADGLVELVAPAADLDEAVDAWFAGSLGRWSAEALRQAVRAVRGPVAEAAARRLPEVEQLYLKDAMRSRDAIEGLQAFLEKRAAVWKDE
ncbi:MAG: enoyl-CoA hydratase/isomerase family protein [Vicinamibacterales bacterium]